MLLNFWRPTHDYIRNSCPGPTKPNERCSGATYKNTRRQNPQDDAQLPIGGRKLTAVNAATVTTLTIWTSQFKKSAPANATPSLSKKIKPASTATKASHTNCLRGRSRRRKRRRGGVEVAERGSWRDYRRSSPWRKFSSPHPISSSGGGALAASRRMASFSAVERRFFRRLLLCFLFVVIKNHPSQLVLNIFRQLRHGRTILFRFFPSYKFTGKVGVSQDTVFSFKTFLENHSCCHFLSELTCQYDQAWGSIF